MGEEPGFGNRLHRRKYLIAVEHLEVFGALPIKDSEQWTRHFQLHNVTCIDQDTRPEKNISDHGSGELSGSSAGGGDAYLMEMESISR